MPTNPYDAVPYPCWPRLETHPDRLAAVAILHGMTPAPVQGCRVLELGCGDGGNLIPMAYALPDSEFTGIELARAPVAAARERVKALGMANIRILRADLRQLTGDPGKFDYIVAHGLYSWIDRATRDALLALCRTRLAPSGVAFVSYNVYPGRHIRQALREMALYHTGGVANLEEARSLLEVVRSQAMLTPSWRGLLGEEIDEMLGRESASLFHDDLAPVNDPVYFHEFAAHAARHRLQYLGDAHLHESLDTKGVLQGVQDRVAREQYLDFLKMRRFRQTLLCRAEIPLSREPLERRVSKLAFSSPARVEGDYLVGVNNIRVRRTGGVLESIAGDLSAAWPRPVRWRDLRAHDGAREVLHSLCRGGFVEPHAWHFPAPAAAGGYPRSSALARLQLRASRYATNLCHRTVEFDDRVAGFMQLTNGTRDRAALAKVWGLPKEVETMLAWMARMALLEG